VDGAAGSDAKLNPLLRGGFGHFKHAHPTEFASLGGFIRRRLRAIRRILMRD
jgi:RNA-directed DNA polymerase